MELKKVDKKKVLPTKKFPELKLMINGEYRASNQTLSSDDEALNVSVSLWSDWKFCDVVSPNQKIPKESPGTVYKKYKENCNFTQQKMHTISQ